jgi:hypothetical protein
MIDPEDLKNIVLNTADQELVAAVLNAIVSNSNTRNIIIRELIDGGHCSPPVWDLKTPGHVGSFVYKTREHAERVCYPNKGEVWTIEHWKGKTE